MTSSDVSNFPRTVILGLKHKTAHSVFALRKNYQAWRARGSQQKHVCAEPCGLEDTHDTALHVHRAVVSTPNERAKTRETQSNLLMIRLSDRDARMGLFRSCE